MSDDMPPPFSFERCGQPKDILEAMSLEHCEYCEIDLDLERKRPALYEALGVPLPAK